MNMIKLQTCSSYILSLVLLSWLIFFPLFVVGECTCDIEEQEEDIDVKLAMKYKIFAIVSILVASAIGVCLPVLGKRIPALEPEKDIFFVVKAFAAGVILATAFIHILPDAFDDLTSPCLKENPWGNFPFTGFIAMMSAILTLMVDTLATGYYKRSHFNKSALPVKAGDEQRSDNGGHLHMHGHSHALVPEDSTAGTLDVLRHRVISQVLELGIVVHSVLIGVTVGVSQSPSSIKPLVAALVFHQLFEGMGLGGCIAQAKFKGRAIVTMALFFSLTTPVGIGIGIGVSNVYNESSPTALIVQGVLNAAAAGILIYMSLVDLLAADFMNPKMQSSGKLQFAAYISLLLGACCMSILAKWA